MLYKAPGTKHLLLNGTHLIAIIVFLAMGIFTTVAGIENSTAKQMISTCPDKDNCVSSLDIGTKHYVEPLNYQGSIENSRARLLQVINEFSRTQVIENSGTYIRATFTTFLFRFTDDVEFQIDNNAKLIHMRSASRVGYSDLGTNRRRCEEIRKRFNR